MASGGAARLGLAPTRTAQLHQLVLGDMGSGPRHLEDLAALDRRRPRPRTARPHRRAQRRRSMRDHLVGIGYLGQVMALVAGLLAGPPLLLRPALGAVGRRLGQPLGRGRHRGVTRSAPHAPFEFDDPGLELGDAGALLFDHQLLRSNQLLELLVGGVVELHDHQSTRSPSRSRALCGSQTRWSRATFKSRPEPVWIIQMIRGARKGAPSATMQS